MTLLKNVLLELNSDTEERSNSGQGKFALITLEGDQPVIRESFLQYCARVCKKEGTAVCGLGSIKG